jgi:hypothetical protein
VYYSKYISLFASCMIAYGCLYVDVLSNIDGEQFVDDQEQYFEEQDQQELYFDQGKYNMRFSCRPIHFNHIKSYCMCLSWIVINDFLVLIYTLWPMGFCIG